MNILITGGGGFIGSHVLNYLVNKYTNNMFICLDKFDYCSNKKNIQDLSNKKNFKLINGNILNSELINHILEEFNIDVIIHFAAQTHVDNSFGNSITFTENNVLGTHTLLECSKKYNLKKFIHVSTDEIYGEVIDNKASETSILNPNNPYSCSKAGAEFMCQAYKRSFNLPIIITRGNNVFGENQFPEKVIPKFVNQILNFKKITIHGNGSARRNFIYVKDVCTAFETILFKGIIGEIYNIGTDFEIDIKNLAKKIINIMKKLVNEHDLIKYFTKEQINYINNYHIEDIEFVKDRNFNDARYLIDSTKLKSLGWEESYDFDSSLENTIKWYIIHQEWWNNDFLLQFLRAHSLLK